MHLIFSAIDTQAQFRNFSWWFTNLETIYDVLNSVVARGSQLVKIEIVENDQRTALPVEAFDGTFSSEAIYKLEQEWQQLLSTSVHVQPVLNQHMLGLTRQQKKHYENRIAELELAIKTIKEQNQQVMDTVFVEPCRSDLIKKNEMALLQYHHHLAVVQFKQQLIVDQLGQMPQSDED
ncbi:hypothetical protein [Spirosoma aerophilum]